MAEDSCEMECLVASQYELVRRILEPLSDSDLDSCEQVNKLWANAVKAERNSIHRRLNIEMFSWKGKPQTTSYYAKFELQGSENHTDLYDSLKKWRSERNLKPEISLTISSGEGEGGPDDTQMFLADPFRVSELLGTRNIQISSRGIVIGPNGEAPHEIENLGHKETPALGSFTFANCSRNAQIIPFTYLENEKIHPGMRDLNCASLKELIGSSEVRSEEVKCVVFMSNILEIERTKLIIQTLGNITKRNVAIGGCIGHLAHDSADSSYTDLKDMLQESDRFYTTDEPGKYGRTVGLLFSGSGVKAASVLLRQPFNTKSKVEQELKKLKDVSFNEKKSCAFMFACCGRGQNFYKGKSNMESNVFKQLYPNTPLLGIFGNGEIGLTYLPIPTVKDTFSDPAASAKKQKLDQGLLQAKEFSHSFTTVFVMLSFQ